jgi:microcystin-dependent protein
LDLPARLGDGNEKALDMTISLLHAFHSPKTDGTDVTLVKPSNWNAEHAIIMDEGIWGRPPGSGTGPPQEIPISSFYYSGMILMYAGTTAPAGFFICNGQLINRTTYAALFAVIGTYYGVGDGMTTFAVPDLRGRVAAGVDPGTGRLTTATVNNPSLPGGVGGQETEQAYADVNVYSTVSGRSYGQTGGEAITAHVWGQSGSSSTGGTGGIIGSGPATPDHSHYVDIWGNAYGVQSVWADGSYSGSGSGGGYTRAVSNLQPTLLVNFLIKS